MKNCRPKSGEFASGAFAYFATSLLVLCHTAPCNAADAQLFERIPESTISDQAALERLRFVKSRALLMYETLRVDAKLLESNQVTLVLPGGQTIQLGRTSSERTGIGDYSWSGKSTTGYGEAVFTVSGQRVLGS